jgi:hypothetical protein
MQIVGLRGETYEKRCKEAGIDTLERTWSKGIDKVNSEPLFQNADEGEQGQQQAT